MIVVFLCEFYFVTLLNMIVCLYLSTICCRMQAIEKRILASSRDAPDEVYEVKAKVEALREKLEVYNLKLV